MPTNIIDKSNPGIVMQETQISLSDEKLKAILLKTYEAALKDANAPKYYKSYSILLSIAGTLLITLLTSSFGSLGRISAETVTIIAWIVLFACAVLGFIFLGIAAQRKMSYDTAARDKAISEIFEGHCSSEK